MIFRRPFIALAALGWLLAAPPYAVGSEPSSGSTLPSATPGASPTATPGHVATPTPASVPTAAPGAPAAPSAPAPPGTVPAVSAASGLLSPLGLGSAPVPQPYEAFVKKAERQSGLIDILKKDDELYFDLGPEQFDHPYIIAPVLASGVGAEAFAGRIYPSFIIEFKRVGRRVLWIDKNADFSAPTNSSAAAALAISVTDSVINSTPVAAEDEKTKHAIVSASFFLTDFENVGRDIGGRQPALLLFGGPPAARFTVDPTKSYIEKTKALPKNDELLASLAFAGPAGDLSGAPDGRGVRLRMHYSIVEPPAGGRYVPRLADDRVGYFITAQKRFDNDALPSPFLRYIDRWNFNNGPIVYYLTDEVPARYKPAIRSALLKWNGAFAKAGVPNAVEVRDQPRDAGWDPDDVRYSTVRWITSDTSLFSAYGPHIADPRTGEIFRVEIVIDGEALRAVKRGYADVVAPTRTAASNAAGIPIADSIAVACVDPGACDTFEADSAEMAATGTVALRASGATPLQTERYAQDWLYSAVLHESGHNFGLRHNFISATLYSLAQIHDKSFTRTHGIVGSVMGYTPTNLSPPGKPQGDYFQMRLGPYDEWAIRYGYLKFPHVREPADERAALRAIADQGSRPSHAYATDEDASGPLAVDPRVAHYHLSSDPLAFDENQFMLIGDLWRRLDAILPRDDRPYYEERQTFVTMLRSYDRAALLAAKYVGGTYASRDHRGQPGGKRPFSPVPRAQSRRAFALLADHVFSSDAFRFSPRLLSDLGPNYFLHRGVGRIERPDFPIEERIAAMQDDVMFELFSPDTMTRLADEAYKLEPGEHAMSLADLFEWTRAAVWDDLGPHLGAIDPVHRALQRRYTALLVALTLAPSFVVQAIGYPADSASLSAYELRRLSTRIDVALRSPRLDVATRAHLEDERSRVRHALAPGAVRGA